MKTQNKVMKKCKFQLRHRQKKTFSIFFIPPFTVLLSFIAELIGNWNARVQTIQSQLRTVELHKSFLSPLVE